LSVDAVFVDAVAIFVANGLAALDAVADGADHARAHPEHDHEEHHCAFEFGEELALWRGEEIQLLVHG